MADNQRRYAPQWNGVVCLMADWAVKHSDDFLGLIATSFRQLVEQHYNGSEGCAACGGEIEHCSPWADAQDLMIAWLIGKVDI